MNQLNETHNIKTNNDEINFLELFSILFDAKWLIVSITSIISIITVLYSLSLPNIYQSTSLLAPNKPVDASTAALQSYSNLANIAGVSLSSQGVESNELQAIKKINSLSFFENNILPNIELPELMAFKSWDYENNTVQFDEEIYEESSNMWVRNFKYPQKLIPSAQESFKVFKENHLTVIHDPKLGFVTIKVNHQSPHIAREWSALLIEEINSFYRQKDKIEAEKSVRYLNTQISKTNLAEIKQVIASLLRQETQKLTLIEANEYYVYEYVDPPVVMEIKHKPIRAIICIIGAFIGGVLGVTFVLLRHYYYKKWVVNSSHAID